jgi:plastocyanin domain-containing protein
MNGNKIKRQALYLSMGAVYCLLVWEVATRWTIAKATPGPHAPAGSVLVNISMVGFDPAVIPAQAGQPLKLAFFRPNAANCAREVVFPSLGVRKELPPGETVVVNITPPKSGPLVFECGMKMLKGQLIVR